MVEAKKGNTTNFTLTLDQLEALQELLSQTKVIKAKSLDNSNPMVSLAKQGNAKYSYLQNFS